MARDLTNTKQNKKIAKIAKRREERFRVALIAVMETTEGRLFLHEVIEQCGCGVAGFDPDEKHLYYAEGKRYIGQSLLMDLQREAPDDFQKMQFEAQQRAISDEFQQQDAEKTEAVDGEDA